MVRDRLLAEASITDRDLIEPPLVADEEVLLVHTPDYWFRCLKGELTPQEVRRIGFPWSEELVRRSRSAVQGTIMTAKNALRDGVASNLAGGTHHAYPDHGEGYCMLNDIAIATRALQRDGMVERVAVIDCDVHQGNGTAVIFKDDPRVFTFSMHGEKNFPASKEESDLDLSLPSGTGDAPYLDALRDHLPGILDRFKPDLVFFQAGVDPFEDDRLGKLKLTIEGLRRRDECVISNCRDRAIPIATTMGGGYAKDLNDTVEAHCNTVRVALNYSLSRRI